VIFCGDVALANEDSFTFTGFDCLESKPWCLNLEGAILTQGGAPPTWGTYNSEDWLDSFSHFRLVSVCIANNHIHDIPEGIAVTQQYLARHNLQSFGAGIDAIAAANSVTTASCGEDYTLLGFGWRMIGCKPVTKSSPGVNRLEGRQVLSQARAALEKAEGGKVVVVIHGNYEFEKYPQPAHRKLARKLIDEGVYAVICHHPHIVSPVERYKGRTIAYSLGNWAFSYGRFFGGRLKFPESSFHQIAVELNDNGDRVHHARFEPPNTVRYLRTESVGAEDFSLKPEFEGFDDTAYLAWFKKNRIKRRGLPIYRNADQSLGNQLRNCWVWVRQRLIEAAVVLRFKTMDRS
jgi:poly-gamma-glutamate synthesis protein (capsule biosynthesis protein)